MLLSLRLLDDGIQLLYLVVIILYLVFLLFYIPLELLDFLRLFLDLLVLLLVFIVLPHQLTLFRIDFFLQLRNVVVDHLVAPLVFIVLLLNLG